MSVVGDLQKNFSAFEFECQCGCGESHVSNALLDSLQDLRDLVGVPIAVTSGRRCKAHNKAVGGAKDSQHLFGKAADIKIKGMGVIEMFGFAHAVPAFLRGGIGLYPQDGFIHVDVRGSLARWARIDGEYVPLSRIWKLKSV